MKVTYDPEVDALDITLSSVQPDHGEDLAPGFIGHFDAHDNLVGLEVLDASKRLDDPTTITLELLTEPVTASA